MSPSSNRRHASAHEESSRASNLFASDLLSNSFNIWRRTLQPSRPGDFLTATVTVKAVAKPTMAAKATSKEMADTIITIIRKDLADVTKHGASEAKFRKMLKAMFMAALEAKGVK